MYLAHFGLREPPFSITPDTSFFFSSSTSQQALNTLLVAVAGGEGFIKITGEVGSGKTLLCRLLLLGLGDEYAAAYVPNPTLTPLGLMMELAAELGAATSSMLGVAPEVQSTLLLRSLNRRLLDLAAAGRRAIVCLDEVQAMPVETLETLRLLTNLETEKRKLLQVVVFGQPELDDRLAEPSIRQLRQRITFEHRLRPLAGSELARYVRHRLRVAGAGAGVRFTTAALALLRWHSRGCPRLVNIAAHKALMCAFGRGRQVVGVREMREAVADSPSRAPRVSPATWIAALGMMLTAGALAMELARHA